MTADYNGWNDGPEAEREAIDVFTRQEFERETLSQLDVLRKFALRLARSPDAADELGSETQSARRAR